MRRPRVRSLVAAGLCCLLLPALLSAEGRVALLRPAPQPGERIPRAPQTAAHSEAEAASGPVPRMAVAPLGVLPGEFEKQSAVVLGCGQLADDMPDLFAHIALLARGRVDLLALVNGDAGRRRAEQTLAVHHVTAPHVHFVNVKHNSMWARDYGPLTVRQLDGRPALVDAWYTSAERPDDDAVPALLGETMAVPLVEASLFLDGGNLLSNGRGLLLATYHLVDKNADSGVDAAQIRLNLGQLFGARDVVFLEPLVGEPTGHVDMFTTFVSADTVVVASIDPAIDAKNARILDHNAARLSSLRVGGRRMRVVRLAMPAHQDTIWRSYTNVLYANGLLLVPIYVEKDPEGSRAALATYKRLLPNWQVEPIDAEALAALGGALHCITMNMAAIERFPPWIEDEQPAPPLSQLRDKLTSPFPGPLFGTEDGIEIHPAPAHQ